MKAELVCADGVGLLLDYLEDALGPAQRGAVDGHLLRCPRCVAFVKSYRETPRIFRGATAVRLPVELESQMRRLVRDRPWDRSR